MAHVPFSSIEITSVVFLAIFAILMIPSSYIWISYMRAGYPWRYGFWGAFLLCAARLACFISELVFYGSNYRNTSAAIAFIVTLSIGYVGLLECESALFATWAERHGMLASPTAQQLHGKIRLLNIVALVLLIYGSTNYDSSGNVSGTAKACIQAGTILFLVLTIVQAGYLAYGWLKRGRGSNTLALLTVTIAALFVRIIYGVYSTFNRNVSIITFNHKNVKYLVGATLVPEVVALILMITIGFINIRGEKLSPARGRGHPEAYDVEALDAHRKQNRNESRQ
ncbi:hypothetical protein Dda_4760 [Drechslerella dactyloides]|uniref:DUF7702 domain-containing protein n=1 Tax=Drechslerella dactyloides TaxID=74499 RepID=A0AAD6IXI4_DREDA|nr:hypothetical protein Dda_4760 [Drechslerella dactyloides]